MDIGITLDSTEILRKCIAILGIRGSGKSNTAKVISEELNKEGIPLVIIDPDGEYSIDADVIDNFSLDESIPTERVLKEGKSVILDMNDWSEESFKFLLRFLNSLWLNSKIYKRNFFILLEEAHEFIQQGERNQLSDTIVRIALRGRKRGIGMIIVSQRSAKVNKDVLTQSEIYFLHKVVHPVDLKVYKEIIPWKSKDVENEVKKLETGEALFYFNGEVKKIRIRKFEEKINGEGQEVLI